MWSLYGFAILCGCCVSGTWVFVVSRTVSIRKLLDLRVSGWFGCALVGCLTLFVLYLGDLWVLLLMGSAWFVFA